MLAMWRSDRKWQHARGLCPLTADHGLAQCKGSPWQGWEGRGDGELACEPPTAVPEPAHVTLELWEHNRAKGKVQLWEKLLHVVLLVLGHTRHVHELPQPRDFIRMWLEVLSAWECDLVRTVGVSAIPRNADALSEDAYQTHALFLAALASRAQGKAARSRVGCSWQMSQGKPGYCTRVSEP